MSKISVCVQFYPWYREFDRTEELFRVMIPSMIRAGAENFELSISDAGIDDIWGFNRRRDIWAFRERLRSEWKGDLVYSCTDRAITPPRHKHSRRFWVSAGVNIAVRQSTCEYLWLNNIDIEIPENFYTVYMENVGPGRPWFPKCYNIRADMPRVSEGGGWRQGTGLCGIVRADFDVVGGNDEGYIKDRHDSDFFNRCMTRWCTTAESGERSRPLLKGLFHIDHPGTCERTSAFNERGWK